MYHVKGIYYEYIFKSFSSAMFLDFSETKNISTDMPWYNYAHVIATMVTIFLFYDDCNCQSLYPSLTYQSVFNLNPAGQIGAAVDVRGSSGTRGPDDDSEGQERKFR